MAQETAPTDEQAGSPTPAPEPTSTSKSATVGEPAPDAPRELKPPLWRRIPRLPPRALLAVPLLVLVVLFAAPWLELRSAGPARVLSGVTLGGDSLSGHAGGELDKDVASYARLHEERKLGVRIADKRFDLAPAAIGLRVDTKRTTERVLAVGREGGVLGRVVGYWRRRSTPFTVSAVALLDRAKLAPQLDTWEAQALTDRPFAGGISVAGGAVTELPPKRGRRIAALGAETTLLAALVAEQLGNLELPLEVAPLPLPPDAASGPAAEARVLLGGPITLTSSDPAATVTLAPAELGPVLTTERDGEKLRLAFVPERLATLLEPTRRSLEFEPVDAKFEFTPTGEIKVVPGHAGLRIELERLPAVLAAAAKSADRHGELPFSHRPDPALTTEQAEGLGIKGLVSSFTTRHPCCEKRVSNIHRIADILDGKVVRPGETVSTNALVGPRTLKAGFVPAPTIEEGEMVDSIGGGISQFATTFFNALFHGGYDIIERQPHSYWFPRYPMGHEATLSWPKPDVIFKNDTAAGLVIKTSYTGTSITVKLYGDNGGRKVRAEVSGRQNVVPAPIELLPNPKVSPEKEQVKEPGSPGWSVIVSRILTFPDGTKKEERRRVTYKMRPRRIELHPCRVPEGEKGYTGEPCPVPEVEEAEPGAAP